MIVPDYILSYRVRGPSHFSEYGAIGNAEIRPRSNELGVAAVLDFHISADDKSEANKLAAGKYQDQAKLITNVLSFVVEDGIVLGEHYDPIPADPPIQHRGTDWRTDVSQLAIDIVNGIIEKAESTLEEDDRTKRALTWYNLGLSTETPEDRFVAFWTGLEASVKSRKNLTDDEEKLYDEIVSSVEEIASDNKDFRNTVKSKLGQAQRDSTISALARVLIEEAEVNADVLDSLGDMRDARADIVHRGEEVSQASQMAQKAQRFLRDLLDSPLSHTYSELLDADTADGDKHEPYHTGIDAEEWLSIVFDDERGRTLTIREIQRQAYGLSQNIDQIARLERRLPKLSGWNKPLRRVGESEYQYTPRTEWITPEADAILQYLYGGGSVPTDVIAYNANSVRNDVDIDSKEAKEECERLSEFHVVERDGNYYMISQDGKSCIEGRIDPAELTDISKNKNERLE